MVPPRGRALVAADPLPNLSRLLLQLKLKAAALTAHGSTKAPQDCRKAAEALSIAVTSVEAGHPALLLALSQETNSSATEVLQRCRQLLAYIAEVTETQGRRWQQFPRDTTWLLLQPVLRLLLWLVPEHVPQHPQLHQGPGSPVVSAAARAQAACHASAEGQDSPTLSGNVDWRYSLGLAYAKDFVKPALSQALAPALVCFFNTLPLANHLKPTTEGFRLLEECLLWTTIVRRLHNLATEIGRDQAAISTPAGLAGSSHDALPGSYLLSETTRPSTRLIHMANLIFSWLHGRSWILTQMSPSLSPSTDRNGQDKALCITFASQFQPSLHLATFVSSRLSIWGQQLASLLSGLMYRSLPGNDLPWSAYTSLCAAYNGMLLWLLPGGILEPSGADRAGYMQHLAQHVEMNLRGLMLSFRLLLGSNVAQQELSQHWHSSLSGVDYTVGMIWARLSETAPHQMGAVQSLVFPTQYAAALEPAQQVKGLLGFFISHNSLVSSKAQQQGQGLLPPDQGLHSDWLKAACAAADAIRLLHDAFTTKSCLSLTKQGAAKHDLLVKSVINLLPWLRPPSPLDFMTGAANSRGWAVCLIALCSMLDVSVKTPAAHSQQPALAGDVLGLRVLLDEVLPVLTHAALHVGHHTSCAQGPQGASGQPATLQDSTAQPAGAPENVSNTSPSQISDPCNSSHAAPRFPALPADSILLLLGASATLLRHSTLTAIGSKDAYSTLSRGLNPVAIDSAQDDLVAALGAVLALATDLVSDGPWWQQAKADHPALLIETLSMTAKSLCSIIQGVLQSREPAEPLLSYIATWSLVHPAPSPASRPPSPSPAASGSAPAASTAGNAAVSDCPLMGAGEASDSAPPQHPLPSAQHMSITSLASELVARVWELLADADVVGEAQGPAVWLPSSKQYTESTHNAFGQMLSSCIKAIPRVANNGKLIHCNPEDEEGTRASRDDGSQQLLVKAEQHVQSVIQLCSLAVAVPWERLRAAAPQPVRTTVLQVSTVLEDHCRKAADACGRIVQAVSEGYADDATRLSNSKEHI